MKGDEDFTAEDLIPHEEMVVTVSHEGYAKTQLLDDYQAQHRGGKGKSATTMKEEDFVQQLQIVNTHDTLLCFSNYGKVYWLKAYILPAGQPISPWSTLWLIYYLWPKDERISAMLGLRLYAENQFVVMATAAGTIKKVPLSNFSRPRADGIIAILLDEGDQLVGVDITNGESEVLLFSDVGKVIRFHESHLRPMGRKTRGVRGIRLQEKQRMIAMIIAKAKGSILTATANGFGKRTPIEEYRQTARGVQGVISIRVNERNGKVIGALEVFEGDELMLISDQARLIRTRVDELREIGRNAQGVKLIHLNEGEHLVGLQRIVE